MLVNNNIKSIIKKSLEINESYSAQKKQFDIKTDFLSAENIKNHEELYQSYVDNFNLTSAKLDAVNRSDISSNHSEYRNLKLDETYNMNGAYLHELFFANIGDNNSQINMDTLSYMRINRDFGTFDDWQKDFIACAQSSRCGWAITYLNFYTQSYMNCFVDLHTKDFPAGMTRLL